MTYPWLLPDLRKCKDDSLGDSAIFFENVW